MCLECGCGLDTVGSGAGEVSVSIQDVSKDGEAGLTLNMTATPQQRERFINE
jgi:hypothetical protein